MVKSLSAVLAYLFFLSSAYYLTFYGALNIDIFQYLTAEDMIKGVLYPLKHSIYFLVFLLLVLLATLIPEFNKHKRSTQDSQKNKRSRLRSGVSVSILAIISLALLCYYYLQTGKPETMADLERTVLSVAVCVSMTAIMLYWSIDYRFAHPSPASRSSGASGNADEEVEVGHNVEQGMGQEDISSISLLVDYLTIGTAFYLLASALGFGLLNARKLKDTTEYDYVVGREIKADTLGLNPGESIYLGSIGDKYLFSDRTGLGTHYIVIDRVKLPVLSIHHCSNISQGEGITEFSITVFVLAGIISGVMLVTASILRLPRLLHLVRRLWPASPAEETSSNKSPGD